jgi:hypothetical protein
MNEIWTELGIAPTDDKKEIKKAYAKNLKIKSPEKDPDGFQRLRSAYERAMEFAAISEPSTNESGYNDNARDGEIGSLSNTPGSPPPIGIRIDDLNGALGDKHPSPLATATQYIDELFYILDDEGEDSAIAFFRYLTESEDISDAKLFGQIESLLYDRVHNWDSSPKPKELFYVIYSHYDWIGLGSYLSPAASPSSTNSTGFNFSYLILGLILLSLLRTCGNTLGTSDYRGDYVAPAWNQTWNGEK